MPSTESSIENCAYCKTTIRVESVYQIKRGMHITKPGESCKKYCDCCHTQCKLYDHHAIVMKVTCKSESSATLILLENAGKSKGKGICKRNIDLKYDEIYIIKYRRSKYNAKQIILNAVDEICDSCENKNCYCICNNNCEHFVSKALLATSSSFQVRSAFTGVFHYSVILMSIIFRSILNFLDDFAAHHKTLMTALFWIAFAVYFAYALVITIIRIISHKKKRFDAICTSCCKWELIDMWYRFAVFAVVNVATFLYMIYSYDHRLYFQTFTFWPSVFVTFASVCIQTFTPSLRKTFQFPFPYKEETEKRALEVGDVIRYKGGTAIVSQITDQGEISVIKFSRYCFWFLKIVEVTKEINNVKFLSYGDQDTKRYKKTDSVERARSRIGEVHCFTISQRFHDFWYWVQVEQSVKESHEGNASDEEINFNCDQSLETENEGKKELTTPFIRKYRIFSSKEIKLGDVVEYRNYWCWNKGIVVKLENQSENGKSEFKMTVMCKAKRRNIPVNLKKDTIYICQYHPARCYEMNERKNRADSNSQKSYCLQSSFVYHCILKQLSENCRRDSSSSTTRMLPGNDASNRSYDAIN